MEFLIGFVLWTAMVLLGKYIAGQKGRSKSEGFWLGFLFGPFGVLLEALLPNMEKPRLLEARTTRWSVAFVLTTLARVAAAALFLLWGAFFVAHVQEWFLQGHGRMPPGWVWVGQFLHGAMLCALASLVFRPRAGALATLIATLAFFGWIDVLNYLPAITLAPVMLVALAWLARSLSAHQPPAGLPAQ